MLYTANIIDLCGAAGETWLFPQFELALPSFSTSFWAGRGIITSTYIVIRVTRQESVYLVKDFGMLLSLLSNCARGLVVISRYEVEF